MVAMERLVRGRKKERKGELCGGRVVSRHLSSFF